MHNQQLNQLLAMHTYKRPHGSEYEQKFIDRFLAPLADHHNVIEYNQDDSGNIWVTTSYNGKTLFTAHVDTVHSTTGIQKVTYDANLNLLYIDQEAAKTTNCLGADDTAGMWLLLQLIDAGVPGTFVFFRGEEKGGIGSSWAAKHMADYLKDFDRAIAFDRRGQTSVISHQGYGRCCSDDFATALSFAINATDKGVTLRPDSTGVFTDTANLTDLIGECTNVSCGYEAEHTGTSIWISSTFSNCWMPCCWLTLSRCLRHASRVSKTLLTGVMVHIGTTTVTIQTTSSWRTPRR